MKAIELFAGVGGFRLGLERNGHEVVWANEWDKYACDVYDKRFGGQIDRRDLTTVPATDIPAHDIITGGFPCQAFSIAGKRRGFAETRGTLFFEILRIAQHHRTPYLFLENVKGLLNHDRGRTFDTIIRAMDELGYDCQWQVLNSKDFGVPQNRERVFIVGHLRGQPRSKVFPFGSSDEENTGIKNPLKGKTNYGWHFEQNVYTEDSLVRTLKSDQGSGNRPKLFTKDCVCNEGGICEACYVGCGNYLEECACEPEILQLNKPKHSNDRVYGDKPLSPTLNTMQGGNRQPKVMRTPLKFLERNQKNIEGDYAYTVDSMNTGGLKVEGRIRRLTPVECERLQGFPDNWTAQGVNGAISDTQRYKMMGNAVTVNVIEAIASKL